MNCLLKLWIALLLITVALSESEKLNKTEKCPVMKSECQAWVELLEGVEETKAELIVSCICFFKENVDISEVLEMIWSSLKCRYIPNNIQQPRLWRSSLIVQNCDVKKKFFSEPLLKVLRRSEHFDIKVEGAKVFRFKVDSTPEDVDPSINATFLNSEINSFPQGLFAGAKNIHMNVSNSRIEAIPKGAFSNFRQNSSVHLSITTSDIKTVKSLAFSLPPEATLVIEGGSIEQWEFKAYQGGRKFSLVGVKITSIQTNGVNIYGLKTFKMEACFITDLQDTVLYEEAIDDQESMEAVEELEIRDNSIIRTHPNAFAGLCREKSLNFFNNYLGIVDGGPLVMKLKECNQDRKWVESTNNTGMVCGNCTDMLSSLDEQVCSVYRTAWCISCNIGQQLNGSSKVFLTEEIFDKNCRTRFYQHVTSKCSYSLSEKYKTQCTEALNGYSLSVIGEAQSIFCQGKLAIVIFLLITHILS